MRILSFLYRPEYYKRQVDDDEASNTASQAEIDGGAARVWNSLSFVQVF
jgi:hypothetical protein